jgi:hypothetical protein
MQGKKLAPLTIKTLRRQRKARLDRRGWDRGDRAARLPLVGGLTASGQNITLSLTKSCAPLIAAREGREGNAARNNVPPLPAALYCRRSRQKLLHPRRQRKNGGVPLAVVLNYSHGE